MKRKILITGSTGYLGSRLVEFFQAEGFEVITMGRKSTPGLAHFSYALGSEIDAGVFKDVEVLIHCAYDFVPLTYSEIDKVNVQGTVKLFQDAKANDVKKLIFISSMSAFEGCKSNYGRAKLAAERDVLRLGGICIRPGLIWGEKPGGLVKALSRMTQLPLLPVVGYHKIIYTCKDTDLCRLCGYLVNSEARSKIVTAADPKPLAFSEVIRGLARSQGRNIILFPVPWWMVYFVLRFFELILRRSVGFRSDSLLGLLFSNPNPDFSGSLTSGLSTTSLVNR